MPKPCFPAGRSSWTMGIGREGPDAGGSKNVMRMVARGRNRFVYALVPALLVPSAFALNPAKSLTQYTRTVWTQEHGLPQDTIRAITQTNDGYLWLGTDEGLARFDGYEFVVYDKANSNLPANSVAALASTTDGSLWIGTPAGLTLYRDREFRNYTTKDGLPDNSITELYEDHAGTLWLIAGGYLSRFQDGKFTNWAPGKDIAVTAVRHIREDRNHDLWVSGFAAVLKISGGKFVPVLDAAALNG